jgi:carbonic anhydrase
MKFHSQESLEKLKPKKALEMLQKGNERFVAGKKTKKSLLAQVEAYAGGQFPFAVVVSCMDSRTTVEHIFDLGLGDAFVIRIAGNVINDDILGSIEYACGAVGSKLVVVLGHSKCGAVKGACANVELGNLTQLLDKVQPSIKAVSATMPGADHHSHDFIEAVAHQNVKHGIDEILAKSPLIKDLVKKKKIAIAGGFYDISTGKVDFM